MIWNIPDNGNRTHDLSRMSLMRRFGQFRIFYRKRYKDNSSLHIVFSAKYTEWANPNHFVYLLQQEIENVLMN
jgi:hypothetical protein